MKQQTPTFNDGIVSIYSLGNIADSGNMPKEGLTIKVPGLRYDERTVGLSRFWTAKQVSAEIDLLIRTPQLRNVSTLDIAISKDGEQYKIVQIQYPKDVEPPVMDLSLQRLGVAYDIK
jgi:hypothetical protein